MERITIKNVAEEAGVSVTSVSRVLNNRGYISDELRNKVMSAVKKLNYTPNEIARSFFKNETRSIALIVPTINNPFFSELAFYIERELANFNYHLFVGNSLNNSMNEKEYLQMLDEKRVDGIIVGSHNMGIDEYDKIQGNIVSIERRISEKIPMIESDNYHGGKIATEELIKLGCKNIICISGNKNVDTPANNRVAAYSHVLKDNNMEEFIIEIPFSESEEEKLYRLNKLFHSNINFDGVFAGDDLMAKYIMNIANEKKINLQSDLKIIGFDGTSLMQNLVPELMTVVQPIERMAKTTVEVLLKLIKGEKVKDVYTLPVKLKVTPTSK